MKRTFLLGTINITIAILLIVLLLIGLFLVSNLKYVFLVLLIMFFVFCVVLIIKFYLSKKVILYNLSQVILLLFNVVLGYFIFSLNSDYMYLENIFVPRYEYNDYSLYILKETPIYLDLNELDGKKVGILVDNNENVKKRFLKDIKADYKVYNNIEDMKNDIVNGVIQSFILENDNYIILDEGNDRIVSLTKNVYTIKVKKELNS